MISLILAGLIGAAIGGVGMKLYSGYNVSSGRKDEDGE